MEKCACGVPTGSLPACFAQVSDTGGTASGDSGSVDGETALDMDMISAACPDCSILMVGLQGQDNYDVPVATAIKLGAVAISISFGQTESGSDSDDYTTPGHLVLAASGDYGYLNVNMGSSRTPSYPSSATSVLAVGGTALYNNGSSYNEAVWDDGTFSTGSNGQDVTTSGCSTEFPALAWQATGLAGTGCKKRATADVSAAATFFSGGSETAINAYCSSEGGMIPVEGTSASSPMVAAILTRLGLAEKIADSMSGTNPDSWIYANPTGWNDLGSSGYPVHSGGPTSDAANPSSCGKLCSIASGWDGPTGMGSPNGAALAALAGTGTGTGSGSGTSSASHSSSTHSSSSSSTATGTGTGTGTGKGTATSSATGTTSTTATTVATSSTPVSGTGSSSTATAPLAGLGESCGSGSDCESSVCGAESAASSDVCTQACSALSPCPSGFECTRVRAARLTKFGIGNGSTARSDLAERRVSHDNALQAVGRRRK